MAEVISKQINHNRETRCGLRQKSNGLYGHIFIYLKNLTNIHDIRIGFKSLSH